MGKYHISKSGKPAPCRAIKWTCPLGGRFECFDTKEEASHFVEKFNEAKNSWDEAQLEEMAKKNKPEFDWVRTALYERRKESNKFSPDPPFSLSELKISSFREADAGCSFSLSRGTLRTGGGFVVSEYPEKSLAIDADQKMTEEEFQEKIKNYVKKNKKILSQDDKVLGFWRSPYDKTLYVDISTIKENAALCRDIGERKDQQDYFDLQTFSSITIDPKAMSGQGASK